MLAIHDLSKTYDNGVHALRSVELDIPRGAFGLLGPNGAGKSSLMRTVATLQDCDRGSIVFDGIDVRRDPNALRRVLGYLPQDFGVYPRISVYAMLDHLAVLKGISRKGERRDAIEGLLHAVNLWDARHRRLGTFSGGMRQRFGIAQALLGDPELLIVDEPTAGLDPAERRRFLGLLAELGESIVVILSTHFVADVREVCQNLAILDRGRVLVQGDPQVLVKAFDGSVWEKGVARDELERIRLDHHVLSTRLQGGRSVVRVRVDACPGEGFVPATPDLEDVYFDALAAVAGE